MLKVSSSCDIIIFGGHGDLALRKLLPALFHLFLDGHIDPQSRIILTSRENIDHDQNKTIVHDKLKTFLKKDDFTKERWEAFSKHLYIFVMDLMQVETLKALASFLEQRPDAERINYLSTAPSLFALTCKALDEWNLINANSRVVLEKPIGRDLESSQAINDAVAEYFEEKQIYRIDHYLGKDTVQNLMALRFSNMMFLPLWNSNNIDHVQITVAESVGLEGRLDYYENYGAMRDMIQNHLLQLLCLIAMEPPCSLDADSVRDEKVKVLRSLRAITQESVTEATVRGRYTSGAIASEVVKGYLEEEGITADSTTETFAAVRVDIDNWRWQGVPFYVRTGKRMRQRNTEIVIRFKEVPFTIFDKNRATTNPNTLVISLQPKESITLKMMSKVPGLDESMQLREQSLELAIPENAPRTPDAYERLLLDVIRANPTLFMRRDEVEAAWRWADPILKLWQEGRPKLKNYSAGSDGPTASIAMIERDGRSWYEE